MKNTLLTGFVASGAALVLSGSHAQAQTVLFDDTFARGVNSTNDLTPNFNGQSGVDSTLTYTLPTWTGSSTVSMQVLNNQLFKANTGQMGIWALNHNFTDGSILSSGGFSITQDIVNIGTAGSTPQDRYCGYGVGLSLAQVGALADDNSFNTGPRGSITGGTTGVAAFYVDLDLNDQIQVFTGGTHLADFSVAPGTHSSGGNLETVFNFSDFNQGSTVGYDVLFNGTNITSGTFTWSSTDNNYIAGSMRSSSVTAGELTIAATPEPSTVALVAAGVAGLALRLRRKN